MLPRWITYSLMVFATLALLPFACAYKARHTTSPLPRIHLLQDMDKQPKAKAQSTSALFADGRAARQPVPGTVARGRLSEDDWFHRGLSGGQWATTLPVETNPGLLARGQERYGIYCSPCHGLSGYGDGIVAKRADRLQEGTWVPPTSLHDETVRARPDGHLFNTITNGIRTMPAYGSQIGEGDRWAIVAYVRALQLSQRATMAAVPPDMQPKLR
jgi:mono/diheme cytochrome c family protein